MDKKIEEFPGGSVTVAESDAPLFVQINELIDLARRSGLCAAADFVFEANAEIREKTEKCRSQDAILFRLKQIDGLLKSDLTHAQDKAVLQVERSRIFENVSMPVGVPIAQLAGESPEAAAMIAQFVADLKSGKCVLS